MEVKLFTGNPSQSTTREDLIALFKRAGEVIWVDLITDHKSGMSRGFAFMAMSARSEADKAVSLFNSCSLDEHFLKVFLIKPRARWGVEAG